VMMYIHALTAADLPYRIQATVLSAGIHDRAKGLQSFNGDDVRSSQAKRKKCRVQPSH